MSFITSASATIDATLTRLGRQRLASSTENFNISQFGLSDSIINYQLIDSVNDNIDTDDSAIMALPIPSASTNGETELSSLIYVNATFLDQQFAASSVQTSQRVAVTTSVGDVGQLFSDDSAKRITILVTTFNPIDRPYVASSYRFVFNSAYDFYTLTFISPPFTVNTNNNWTQSSVNSNEYIFSASNKDNSGVYTNDSTGIPAIDIDIQLLQTPMLFNLLAQPENRQQILIPDFLTVYQIDASNVQQTDVSSATLSLQIINVL